MTVLEKKVIAEKLYSRYFGLMMEHNASPYFVKNREKYFHYFIKIVDNFWDRPEFDYTIFLKAVFDKRGPLYPQQLSTEKTWKDYLETRVKFVDKKSNEEKELELLERLKSDYKAVMVIVKSNKKESILEDFDDDFCMEMIKRSSLDGILLSFSKKFTDQNVDVGVSTRKMILYSRKNVRKFLKEIFKDDLYIEDVKVCLRRHYA